MACTVYACTNKRAALRVHRHTQTNKHQGGAFYVKETLTDSVQLGSFFILQIGSKIGI